jgi:hypothetical protein
MGRQAPRELTLLYHHVLLIFPSIYTFFNFFGINFIQFFIHFELQIQYPILIHQSKLHLCLTLKQHLILIGQYFGLYFSLWLIRGQAEFPSEFLISTPFFILFFVHL